MSAAEKLSSVTAPLTSKVITPALVFPVILLSVGESFVTPLISQVCTFPELLLNLAVNGKEGGVSLTVEPIWVAVPDTYLNSL